MSARTVLLAAAVACGWFNVAKADVVYNYVGPHVTGTLDLAQPLGNNLSYSGVTPVSLNFSDGFGDTFTGSNSSTQSFQFDTNGSGAITGFIVQLQSGSDFINIDSGHNNDHEFVTGGGFSIVFSAGTWNVAAVPEPSTWAMMVIGFAALGCFAYRRHGQSNAQRRFV